MLKYVTKLIEENTLPSPVFVNKNLREIISEIKTQQVHLFTQIQNWQKVKQIYFYKNRDMILGQLDQMKKDREVLKKNQLYLFGIEIFQFLFYQILGC